MKQVLMVIAKQGFKDIEYFEPKQILEDNEISVHTASTEIGTATGSDGKTTSIDFTVADFLEKEENMAQYEAVIFVGGGGMEPLTDDANFQKLAINFFTAHKIVAAICVAPILLAKAGLLRGRDATVSSNQEYIDAIVNNGAEYLNQDLVVADNIITASGPKVAYKFGLTIMETINK
ncbi:MAG: DJ-1/PfpI family protein [Patescibacteria group bacterium]|jgi:protease I